MRVKNNELQITRIYNAPIKMVWDAWADPKKAAKWWGPRGFTITTHSKDLKAGGHWAYTMHGPDGVNYENKTIYHEVQPYTRMVYDHGGNDDRPPLFRVTVTFKELPKDKTEMFMIMALPTPEAAKESAKFVKQAGGNGTWDRLAEFLDEETTGKDTFVINRLFPAPIEKMFEMWTKPEHFSKWLAPTGMNMKFMDSEIKTGSTTTYSMSTLDKSMTMYGRAHYLEIQKPNRIVYTQEFTDERGNLSRHPHLPLWPATLLTSVTLTAESATETRVTVEWQPYGNVTAEEIAEFTKIRAGMTQGWTGSFDKLEELLSN